MPARTPLDRYEAAGLTHNPFAAPQLHGAQGVDVANVFVDRGLPPPPPPGSSTLVQVIGESGYGKSTQLHQWRRANPGPYHYIDRAPYQRRWASPPSPVDLDVESVTIYGDEIDRMPAALRYRWFRSLARANATLVIGTHKDLSGVGSRAGFKVITHRLTPVDGDTMALIIDKRLRSASLDDQRPLDVRADDFDIDLVLAESQGIPGEADVVCHRLLAQRVL